MCNLSFTKIIYPVRGSTCDHISCFSLLSFFEILKNSEFKKNYCPICGEPLPKFFYDSFIEKVIEKSGEDETEITVNNINEVENLLNNLTFKKND